MTTESPTPTTLADGRYRVVATLGAGGMATVYQAWDERLQVGRAIKILNANLTRSRIIQERFLTEARTMARLHHPNIVGIHDIVDSDECPYIVMELVAGGSLSDWCKRHGPMPPRMACRATLATLAALDVAHDSGVIHRDIKPHNILVTRSGVAKVTDFGIAQIQDDSTPSLTKTGSTMGTLGYMAPEQRINAREVDPRADVYATGATLWSLLKNAQPLDLFLMPMGKAEHMRQGLPPALADIIANACFYDIEDRYPSALAMAKALEQAVTQLEEDPESPALISGVPNGMERALTPPPLVANETITPHQPANPTMVLEEAEEPAAPTPAPASKSARAPEPLAELFEDEDIAPLTSPMPRVLGVLTVLLLLGAGIWWWEQEGPAQRQDPMVVEQENPLNQIVPPDPEPETVPELSEPPKVPEVLVPEMVPDLVPDERVPDPKPRDTKPVDEKPRDTKPVDEKPRDTKPVDEKPVDEKPVDEKPRDTKAVDEKPVDPPVVLTGTVRVSGDALRVVLLDSAGVSHATGIVPVGSYTVRAAFSDGLPVTAGKVTVKAGGRVSITCSEAFAVCK
ncbi:MAG: serine/threonine protein kinase [Cognaticolwellia sp.]